MIDLFSQKAAAVVAAMRNARNAIYFGKAEEQENVRLHLASQLQPRKSHEESNKPGCSTSNLNQL